jgi:PAS domain S-box-containing protein
MRAGPIAAPDLVVPAPRRAARGCGGWSVRVYLVALVLALLLPAWAVATFAVFRLAEAGRQAVAAKGIEMARAVAAATEREIGALHAGLVALSTSPALAAGDLARFHHQATTLAAAIGGEVVLAAADGRQLVNTALPFGAPLPRATWADGLEQGVAAASDTLVPEVIRAPVGGRATIAVSLPVPLAAGEGEPDGASALLSIGADAVRFWSQALRRVALPPDWSAAVHDRRGTILAHRPDPEHFVGQPAHPDTLAAIRAAPADVAAGWSASTASRDGRPVYVAWQRLSAAPWTALVEVPEAAADGTMRRSLISVTAGGALIVFGLSLGLAAWGTRRIARPLARLERAAEAVGRGEVPGPGPATGLRELDAVAIALAAAAAERREREAEGAALAARLDSVLESTTDAVVMVDANWRIGYANGRARQLLAGDGLGAPRAVACGLLGASLWDAFRADPDGPFEAAFRRAMRERLPQGVSGYHARLGRWLSADAVPGGGDGLILFLRDVSAARIAEAALRDSEARLKAVLEHVPVGVLLAEAPAGRLLLANRRAAELLGEQLGASGMTGLGVAAPAAGGVAEARWQAYDPRGRRLSAAQLPLARTLASGAPAEDELRLLRPDGSTIWIRAWSAPIRDVTGRLTGAVVAFADIGAEREAAEALRRQVAAEAAARRAVLAAAEALAASEERFRRFAEASPDGLWIGDPEGQCVEYVSPAFERIWGLSRAALAAAPGRWLEHVHPDDREQAAAAQRRAAAGAAPAIASEYRVLLLGDGGPAERDDGAAEDDAPHCGPDGVRLRWVRDILFPIRDAAGRVVRVGRLVRDVTPRKRWEERQAMLMGELNHRVKNTLATVQSLARQTAHGKTGAGKVAAPQGGGRELERFLADFQARLLALSRAHDLLTARTWRGATLGEVVAAALAPWRSAAAAGAVSTRIVEEGPVLWLAPRQALGFALGLHELATNAAKHGALSRRGGTVTLRWEAPEGAEDGGAGSGDRSTGLACLTWRERGGPEVRPPTRSGFGTRLLERGLAGELGRDASVALRYDPAGFEAIIRFRAAPPSATAASGGSA